MALIADKLHGGLFGDPKISRVIFGDAVHRLVWESYACSYKHKFSV